jgi:adenosylcobinamide amidohydrolase
MNIEYFLDQVELDYTQNHIHLKFANARLILNTSVLNGGMVEADHFVNMKVPKTLETDESPEETIMKYSESNGWYGNIVGMMTAASMDSLRIARDKVDGVEIVVLVTSGLSNPRRVGDRAEYRYMGSSPDSVGTINIIALTSARLTMAALVEALMIVTEARAAALQKLGVQSPVSNEIATGTGTDAIGIVNGFGPTEIRYCGKHVLFGEILGRLAIEAVTSSTGWELKHL